MILPKNEIRPYGMRRRRVIYTLSLTGHVIEEAWTGFSWELQVRYSSERKDLQEFSQEALLAFRNRRQARPIGDMSPNEQQDMTFEKQIARCLNNVIHESYSYKDEDESLWELPEPRKRHKDDEDGATRSV